MHDTAYRFGQLFYDTYLPKDQNIEIIEIGSQNVNGGLRDIFENPYINYVGVDFVPGPGVDCILDDPYKLPFNDNTFDVLLCSAVLEHSDMFWLLFLEMVRVLKPAGLIYINAPSNGDFHRYPVDCWRFYPDAGIALVKWARYSGYDINLIESFIGKQDQDIWNDFVAVFCKGDVDIFSTSRMLYKINNYTNGLCYGSPEFINYDTIPEDRKK